MIVHVNSLPDDCLLPIFDRVPLLDLLQLDKVCPQWESLLLSACARRRSLVLIGGEKRMDEMNFHIPFNNTYEISFDGRRPYHDLLAAEWDDAFKFASFLPPPNKTFDQFLLDARESEGFFDILYATSMDDSKEEDFQSQMTRLHHALLSGHLVKYFTDLFPNVETLIVIHSQCNEGELHSVIKFLRSSWSLKIVKLWLRTWDIDDNYRERSDQHPLRTLLQSINQNCSLQQLTLDLCGAQDGQFTFPVESFSFVVKLKLVKLYFGFYDRGNTIWDIMHQFDSTELLQIGLGNYDSSPPVNTVLDPKFDFTTKVRQLCLDLNFENAQQFDQFFWRFSSLTMLRMLWFPHITFAQMVGKLTMLKQLTYLKLYFYSNHHPENIFALVDQVDDDESQSVFSLPLVKTLELSIWKRSHDDFESLSSFVFPSVQVLILDNVFWHTCHICAPDNARLDNNQMAIECHRLLVLSLMNKFIDSSVRLYAKRADERVFIDWTNHVTNQQDL